MKKVILFFALACLFSINGKTQTKNVNIDSYRFNFAYRSSPLEPIDPLFYYYSTKVNASAAVKKNISIEEIEGALAIEGEQRTDDPQAAALSLELNLGNIVFKSSRVNDRTESSKNKDGSVTTIHHYSVNVVYSFESSYAIMAKDKVLKKATVFSDMNTLSYSTSEYSTSKEASDFWNNNREVLTTEFYRNLSLQSANAVNSYASEHYGFKSVRGSDVIKTINEKKHNENTAFRAACDAFKSQLESMTPNTPMDKDAIDELIEYFKSIPEKYKDPESKADKHLRYSAYYNLSRIYQFLDEPDKAIEYANLLVANGHDPKHGEQLKKDAEAVKVILGRTKIKTRHFDPNQYFE